jgi:hypothetical protein
LLPDAVGDERRLRRALPGEHRQREERHQRDGEGGRPQGVRGGRRLRLRQQVVGEERQQHADHTGHHQREAAGQGGVEERQVQQGRVRQLDLGGVLEVLELRAQGQQEEDGTHGIERDQGLAPAGPRLPQDRRHAHRDQHHQRQPEERGLLGRVRCQVTAEPEPAGQRTRRVFQEGADVLGVVSLVEAGAAEGLRPGEVHIERVRQQRPGDRGRHAQPGEHGGQRRPGRRAAVRQQRPGAEEDPAGQRGEEQALGGDGEADRHQDAQDEPVPQPATRLGQLEDPPQHQRGDPAGGPIQVAVGVRDEAGGEAAEQAAQGGGDRPVHEMAAEEEIPGERRGGEVEGEDRREADLRAGQDGQRREQHRVDGDRGVGGQVDADRRVHHVGEERVGAVPERVDAVAQQPLEERLISRVLGDHLPGRVLPQPDGHVAGEGQRDDRDEQMRAPGSAAAAGRGFDRRIGGL